VVLITAKFGLNQCSTFHNIQVLIFNKLGLKMHILAPKWGFLGDLTPWIKISLIETPKGTSLHRNMSYIFALLTLLPNLHNPKLYNAFQLSRNPWKYPFPLGAFASSSNMVYGSPYPHDSAVSIPNCILIGSAIFAELMAVPILYNGPPLFHLKIALTIMESWPTSNSWFLGSLRVHILNSISIGSAVFAGLVVIKNRQTDCAFLSVAICCT